MTKEEKELVIIDLSARLFYKPTVLLSGKEHCILCGIDGDEVYLNIDSDPFNVESIKPYLRPMSSMTEEENEEAKENGCIIYHDTSPKNRGLMVIASPKGIDWLNKKMFAYRTLDGKDMFELGIAIKAPEGMYK